MGKRRGINKYKIDGCRIKNDGTIDVHFSLHDATILSDEITNLSGKRLELQLNINGSYSVYHTIMFNDYIIKKNAKIKNGWILDDDCDGFVFPSNTKKHLTL